MKVFVVVCSVLAFTATIPLIKSTNPNLPLCPETPLCKPPFRCPIPCRPRPELPLCPEKPIPLPNGAHAPIPCRPRPTTPAPTTTTTSHLGTLYL